MILIFDLIIWFLIWFHLENAKRINWKISILIAITFFIILKSIILWIFLWLLNVFYDNILIISSLILNIIFGIFLIKKWIPNKEYIKDFFYFSKEKYICNLIFIIIWLLIYNVIPFWWDELMYHLPISIELLNKWWWLNDLWLSNYWHNNIWQWYPKNLYFVIDYFFSNIKNIIWIQIFWVFSFFAFLFSLIKIIEYFINKNNINNIQINYFILFLIITTPVIFLHFFVKVDTLFFSIVLLFIYNLLIFSNLYLICILFFLIISFKITWIFIAWIIIIAYLIYNIIFETKSIKTKIKKIFNMKFILYFIITWIVFLYSFIYNQIKNWNFLYPINIIKTDNSIYQEWNITFWLLNYFKDMVYSSVTNWDSMKIAVNTFYFDWIYNYDRWLWFMWILMIIWIILTFFYWKKTPKKNFFIIILLFTFITLSLTKLSILFWHRYQIFIYSLLIIISSISLMKILKNKIYYLLTFMVLLNLYNSYWYIWAFKEKWSSLQQLSKITTRDYCEKIKYIWDISRDDYRNWWKYICENISWKNILLVNQTFNFYTYWKYFDNKIYNNVLFNKNEFEKFIKEREISYIITSNKNNLYWKFWVENNYIYKDSFDSNDETLIFCSNKKFKNIKSIDLLYALKWNKDVEFYFWINNFSKSMLLNWEEKLTKNPKNIYEKNLKINLINENIENICINMFDNPKVSFDNSIKAIFFYKIEIIDKTWKKFYLDPKDFSYVDYAIEDIWLRNLWFKKIFTDNFNNLDYMYIWKK